MTVLETREEWACVEHWVEQAYQPSNQRYAISLRSDFNHVGDYRWWYSDGTTTFPDYFMWASGHPRDDPCVSMEIGTGVDAQGAWLDGACIEDGNMFAICEKTGPAPTPTPSPSCPEGWAEYEDSCYLYMETSIPWDGAEASCVALGVSYIYLYIIHIS